jgi:hypothetical protein
MLPADRRRTQATLTGSRLCDLDNSDELFGTADGQEVTEPERSKPQRTVIHVLPDRFGMFRKAGQRDCWPERIVRIYWMNPASKE